MAKPKNNVPAAVKEQALRMSQKSNSGKPTEPAKPVSGKAGKANPAKARIIAALGKLHPMD